VWPAPAGGQVTGVPSPGVLSPFYLRKDRGLAMARSSNETEQCATLTGPVCNNGFQPLKSVTKTTVSRRWPPWMTSQSRARGHRAPDWGEGSFALVPLFLCDACTMLTRCCEHKRVGALQRIVNCWVPL